MNILDFKRAKQRQDKIVMVTCYDAPTASIVEKTKVDCVLVGDSVAMVVHGFDNTTYATMEMMTLHTQAVARKLKSKFIIADMPFLSYRHSISQTIDNVQRLIQSGAHAVKLEGASGNLDTIKHIVASGVPVMGHLGLTPQSIHQLGGNKVQGKSKDLAEGLFKQALALEKAGVFSLVLECVPSAVAKKISQKLNCPIIGIGAGSDTDGQVLVINDLLGFDNSFSPKFLKRYMNAEASIVKALNRYAMDVKDKSFPDLEHSY